MKAILISIQPQHVANILNGNKTLEIRKTMPKCKLPIDVYIYCTKKEPYARRYVHNDKWGTLEYIKSDGKVVAKFTLNKVEEIKKIATIDRFATDTIGDSSLLINSCLEREELHSYLKGKKGYAWHIDNLVVFDKPKELKEFYTTNLDKQLPELFDNSIQLENGTWVKPLTRAPQSWQFIEV